jgi:hypothetical protein
MAYLGKQPALQSNEFREEFNITSTTNTIATSGFVVSGKSNYLDVYKNGVLLGSDDYTLGADRKTITLASNAIAGDIIVVIGRRNLTQGVRFSERRHEHTIANNETTVTFPYPLTGDSTDVYLNGVKLASSDFSINVNTKVISFTLNPVNGDVVAIVSREPATSSSTVLPIVDSNGGSVISESNGSVVVNAGTAAIGSNALVVDSSGNVGIGTSSPSQTLSIRNVADNQIRVENGASATQSYEFGRNGSTGLLTFYGNQTGFTGYVFSGVDGERMRIDNSGNLKFDSGFGSVGTAYACRAWIRFNGTGTVSILGSGNVSSLTDLGTGHYGVNFTNAMPDANFSTVTSSVAGGGNGDKGPYTYSESTGSVKVYTYNTNGALVDNSNVKAAIFR